MREYYLKDNAVTIHFNRVSCDSETKILNSKLFLVILRKFLRTFNNKQNSHFAWLTKLKAETVLHVYKALLVWDYNEVSHSIEVLKSEEKRYSFYLFTEQLYDYWRSLERYGFFGRHRTDNAESVNQRLLETTTEFSETVLKLYRTVAQKIANHSFNLLRQLPAGTTSNLTLVSNVWTYNAPYTKLPEQTFVSSLLIHPPLMIYSKSNTRTGMFQPIDINPLDHIEINKNDYVVYPLKIGAYTAYVYTHRNFLKYAVSLGSLFETVSYEDFKDKKPDLIYTFGIDDERFDGVYHHDIENDIYIGSVTLSNKNDYFGYAKKMLLTLHNVKALNEGYLPIHGAMLKLSMNNGKNKNIVIIGDSGAGKSETIEALRSVGEKYISNAEIIYDDMGIFFYHQNKIVSSGTEIGAFVRLDDLDTGYAYKQIDRAVFLNPNRINARVILPTASYGFIMQKHDIDMVLYANNYDDTQTGVSFFNNLEDALPTFEKGARRAKGTTSEKGMTESYFANPFGPAQHQELSQKLLEQYFQSLFDQKIPVGVLYTQLAIDGREQKGPQDAAISLLEYLK